MFDTCAVAREAAGGATPMRKRPFFIFCALLVLASVGSSRIKVKEADPPPDLKPTVDGNCAFAFDLYAHLNDADGNIFLSPYSISSALAIAYGGARGNTEKQMSTTLHFAADQDPFHSAMSKLTPTNSIKAPMMRQNHVFHYAEQDDLRILELPYIGYDLSMLVFLPKERNGLPEMEKRLNGDNVAKWIKALDVWTVDVRFPKFKTESRFSLKQTLSDMGMPDPFSESRADLTGMTPKRPLFIDAVEHAALVEVDEKGTVAAAATSVSLGCAVVGPPPPVTFHADHPFVFLIRDNHTGTILFLGRITDPSK
jgi:serpin B